MTAEDPKVIIQRYENNQPVGQPEEVALDAQQIADFGKSLEEQPDEDGLTASNS